MIELFAEDAYEFLKDVIPFQFATDDEIRHIAQNLSIELYQKDTLILQQGGEPSQYLRVIKKGSVKVYIRTNEGVEVITDYRGEGDLIGYLSLFSNDKARASVITLEETICFLIPKKQIQNLIDKNPAIKDFFNSTFIRKYLDKPVREMSDKGLMNIGSDKLLFTTTTGELASKGVISTFQDVSIKEAADIMTRHKISSLVLIDNNAVPVGFVTDKDFREKVIAKGKDYNDNISSIMSINLIKSEAREYCFEALLKMIRHNIHHLIVVDEGKIKGIITNHDLMMLQGISPINIARDIESQYSVDGLIPISKKTNTIISLLIKEGVKASSIAKIITELNDRLVKKIIDFAEKKFGKPPLSYCWIVFGSEGRKEQTFKTDQDNAIIIEDYDSTVDENYVKEYFTKFSEFVRDSLFKCGFPQCPAGYMASNPLWRQPLSTWKKYFHNWIINPTSEAIIKSLIFFDFRPLYGNLDLAYNLKDYLFKIMQGNKLFLGGIANTALKNSPPIGFLKSFVVEKSGDHKNQLNIKVKGTTLIVDLIRLFAFEKVIKETSTFERIEILRCKHAIIRDLADEIIFSFDFLMLMRIENQLSNIEKGLEPQNFIDPKELSNLKKKMLKETFSLITRMQDMVLERYRSMIL